MFAEINSMAHGRRLHAHGTKTDLSDEMDMLAYILEPDDR